jgi:hypothetical protein
MPAMERTQISLTADQARMLRRNARRRKTSMAALIREAVERTYFASDEGEGAWDRALASVGGSRSDRSDVAAKHDEYLADAFSG